MIDYWLTMCNLLAVWEDVLCVWHEGYRCTRTLRDRTKLIIRSGVVAAVHGEICLCLLKLTLERFFFAAQIFGLQQGRIALLFKLCTVFFQLLVDRGQIFNPGFILFSLLSQI